MYHLYFFVKPDLRRRTVGVTLPQAAKSGPALRGLEETPDP
jgi:hypothetical protein